MDFCYKCYGNKKIIHEAHALETIGQQFVDDESSWSDEDGDEDIDDERTGKNKNVDSSSDNSSTTSDDS